MQGFLQASGFVKVVVPERPTPAPKPTPHRFSRDNPNAAVERLVATLKLAKEKGTFSTANLRSLGKYQTDIMFDYVTRLVDLQMLVKVGKVGNSPMFRLNGEPDAFGEVLSKVGLRVPLGSISGAERRKMRVTRVIAEMIEHLDKVPAVFSTTELRLALDCHSSVACARINIMLREGLIEPHLPELWKGRQPRTYKRIL